MTRTAIRLGLGVGLTAVGVVCVREAWWPAAGYAALFLGSALLVVELWRWLERDMWRRVRWSDEHRARVLSWAGQPEARPAAPPAADGQAPIPTADDGDLQPAAVEQVTASPAGGPNPE